MSSNRTRSPKYWRNHPGAGLVMSAGGRYLSFGWANLALHRLLGSELPMELWHRPGELTPAGIHLFELIGAKPRQLKAQAASYWTMPHAIDESSFDEIVHLGADVTPLHRLDELLDHVAYLDSGALLAADYQDLHQTVYYPSAFERIGLPAPRCRRRSHCPEVRTVDSAILVLNKRGCPFAGGILRELAIDGEESGRYGGRGETEIWGMAWQLAGCDRRFTQFPALPGYIDSSSEFRGLPGGAIHFLKANEPLAFHWDDSEKRRLMATGQLVHFNAFIHAPQDGYYTKHYITPTSGNIYQTATCFGPDALPADCITEPVNVETKMALFQQLYLLADKAFYNCQGHSDELGDNLTQHHKGCPLRHVLDVITRDEVKMFLARLFHD